MPDGFEVTEYAGNQLANDIYCLTISPQGQVVVSGRGYIRVLIEDGKTGKANRSMEVAGATKDGAMGLMWDKDWLHFTGDGGLWRVPVSSKPKLDFGAAELIRKLKTGGEHDAHAILRGPDGWLYVLCGNSTRIDKSFAQSTTSPIIDPVAGCVIRFSPDLKQSEIVGDGFRNAYGMDFNQDGELFTFDSDNERCVSLPWYEPIRFYHVISGGHYGWLNPQLAQWWRKPPYFVDVMAPLATFGRGSPTGVACYRHMQFPKEYRGGLFLLDWTFGKVYFVALKRQGASYTCKSRVFLEAVGDNGFAPTAAAIHPQTGDLFISIGGRGTRGAVYRIRHGKGPTAFTAQQLAGLRVRGQSLDWNPLQSKAVLAQAKSTHTVKCFEAMQHMRRHVSKFSPQQIEDVVRSTWNNSDHLVWRISADLFAHLPRKLKIDLAKKSRTAREKLLVALGIRRRYSGSSVNLAAEIIRNKGVDSKLRLAALRVVQICRGDLVAPKVKGTIWEGYTPRISRDHGNAKLAIKPCREVFPTGDIDLDRELSRTLAMLEDDEPQTQAKMIGKITANSDPVEDIHYLIVLARLRGKLSATVTKQVGHALVELDAKFVSRRMSRDTHWPLRMSELYEALVRKQSALAQMMLSHPNFGKPAHAVFVGSDEADRQTAARRFLEQAKKDENYEWTPAQVDILASLPEQVRLSLMRRLWQQGGLQDNILAILARSPRLADRWRFLAGLSTPKPATIRHCLNALEKLPSSKNGDDTLSMLLAWRRLGEGKEQARLRARIVKLLQVGTGQVKLPSDFKAWSSWFQTTFPKLANQLTGTDGVDMPAWEKRLKKLDWSQGNIDRGKKVFIKASCSSCHSGAQALGPDLKGIVGRFSRDDLFTAILLPSKDVSPRYRTTQITTSDGKVYQGLVIYEAVGSILLQTGPDKTIRITNKQIADQRVTNTSLMPAGLIDMLTDCEIADLYAYLKNLTKVAESKPIR